MKLKVIKTIEEALDKLGVKAQVELTPSKGHGDFSTNIAMKIARDLKDSPVNIANKLIELISEDFIKKMEVAGPGFINIFLAGDVIADSVSEIINKGSDFGRGTQGKFINVEYVSANPTGYLHVGHARGATLGATLSNILMFAGNKVDQEYYINDAGNQIETLGVAVYTRYQQLLGSDIKMPEDTYRGEEIKTVAKLLFDMVGNKYENKPYEESKVFFKDESKKILLENIKEHLELLDIKFSFYSSEQAIYDDNLIEPALEALKEHTFKEDDALWLDTMSQGDDKNRVLIKRDGKYTYFTPDIAYHKVKLERGYDELINVWGADHIGYIKRMEVALGYLGLPKEKLDILTVQLVKLIKDGEEFKMSKRAGTSYTLKDLISASGKDAIRFHMVNRANTSGFDFDITKVNEKSNDNPVFTVQYTHARANQLISKSTVEAIAGNYEQKQIELINLLNKFPSLIDGISKNHKVHYLPQYLIQVSREFNSIYSTTKIIGSENEGSLIALVKATKIVIANGLDLLGVSHPDKM